MGTLSISLTVGVVYTFWGLIFVFLVLALLFMGLTPLNPHQRQVTSFLICWTSIAGSSTLCTIKSVIRS